MHHETQETPLKPWSQPSTYRIKAVDRNRKPKAQFTRYNLSSNRLLNRFDNRLNVCLHDTTGY